MRVVAWCLPSFGRPAHDRSRSLAAIRFRTPDGQRFDAFALDIESTAVADPALRTARLLDLSKSIRSAAGGAASLGAIVPAPVAMRRRPDYWPGFPFSELRRLYDVFLPMDYFTYHYATAGEAHDYTAANISLLRRRTGDAALPIHVIGGIADTASVEQVTAFVHAERERGVLGASLYGDHDHGRRVGRVRIGAVQPGAAPAASVGVAGAAAMDASPVAIGHTPTRYSHARPA